MSSVADEGTCIRLDHVGAWTLWWAKDSASKICVTYPHSLPLPQGTQIMRSMPAVEILTLVTSLGSVHVAPVEIRSKWRSWNQRGCWDWEASPEAAPHEQLSGAVSSHPRCVTVGQEGQGPVWRLLEKFLDNPPIRSTSPLDWGYLGLLVTWEKP
ncbi:unnamed protein product [Ixodes persulcatus]